ncbi:O-antigen polymerase [Escherichia albertii]|uniref:O-antigen polymerase n=1 Tax=Escherichia albertii TaxID=208962 RepID=UPI00235E8B4A|nr:O-antigen polymerase [Escherichia albertii]WDC18644.1 O-antigen ligase [Escherichia albertii]
MIKINKISILILVYVYFFVSLFLYEKYIYPLFSYMGFTSDFSAVNVSFAALLIFIFFIMSKTNGVIGFYHQVIMALILIPSLVLYSVGNFSLLSLVVTLCSIFIVYTASRVNYIKPLKMFSLNLEQLLWLMFLISFCTIINYIIFIGWSGFNLNILKVYEYREAAEDALPALFGYISPATSKIFVPLMIVLAVINKRYIFVFWGVLFSVLIFGFTAHKSPLFYPFLILSIYYFMGCKNWLKYFYFLFVAIVTLSWLDFFLSDIYVQSSFGIFGSFASRRAILLPVLLNDYFIKYFSTHELYYWSESKLTFGLIQNPYNLKMVNLIGEQYFGHSNMSANTGFIGSGYGNAAWFGVVAYSFLLGWVISFLSSFSTKTGDRFLISSSFVVMFAIITSTDFITALLTHGLVLLFLIYMIIPQHGVINTSNVVEKNDA